ncbi:MAG: hypothetical protein IPP94_16855 [Ignavibacteria bacterium]|nr:hypothetical protein [Ignavibacteria bacterium]
MKCIVICIILTASYFAQEQLKGALGLEFGASKAEVGAHAGSRTWDERKTWRDVTWGDERDVEEVVAGRAEIMDEWQLPARIPNVLSVVRAAIDRDRKIVIEYKERGVIVSVQPGSDER